MGGSLGEGVQMAVGLWNLEIDPFVSPKRWFVSLTGSQDLGRGIRETRNTAVLDGIV